MDASCPSLCTIVYYFKYISCAIMSAGRYPGPGFKRTTTASPRSEDLVTAASPEHLRLPRLPTWLVCVSLPVAVVCLPLLVLVIVAMYVIAAAVYLPKAQRDRPRLHDQTNKAVLLPWHPVRVIKVNIAVLSHIFQIKTYAIAMRWMARKLCSKRSGDATLR